MNIRFLDRIPLIKNKTKILISASLLILAIMLYLLFPENLGYKLCLLAMLFSFLGDILLNIVPIKNRPHSLLYTGAFFFMISHLTYASAYMWLIHAYDKPFINPGAYTAYAIMVLIFIISMICIFISQIKLNPFMLFVFSIYLIVISINFITIYSYSYSLKSLSFIGATSFLISDYIIGIETVFKIKNDYLRKLVWIFYPIGQILILVCR